MLADQQQNNFRGRSASLLTDETRLLTIHCQRSLGAEHVNNRTRYCSTMHVAASSGLKTSVRSGISVSSRHLICPAVNGPVKVTAAGAPVLQSTAAQRRNGVNSWGKFP